MLIESSKNIPLILLGAGRSGTTLMFRLLNSQNDIFINGEHGGFLNHLANLYYKINKIKSLPETIKPSQISEKNLEKKYHPTDSWHNEILNKEMIRQKIKNLFKELFLINEKYTYFGFKEINYPISKDEGVIDFILSEYSLAKFIFIFRDPVEVIRSQHVNFDIHDTEKLIETWKYRNTFFLDYQKKYPNNTFFINYNKLITNNKTKILNQVGSFLNIEWDHQKSNKIFKNGGNITLKDKFINFEYKIKIDSLTESIYSELKKITNSQ